MSTALKLVPNGTYVGRMLPQDIQLSNEYRFSRKHIDGYIRSEIERCPEIMLKVEEGAARLDAWRSITYFKSKEARVEQIRQLELKPLVFELFVGIAYITQPVLFTSISAQMASRLNFDDKECAIRTVAEMLAVLCHTDVFEIFKQSKMASLMVVSNIRLSPQLMTYIEESTFLPPMVCEPELITHNRESGYLTHNDSVILKPWNHHDEDVCLDVVNIQNQIPFALNEAFLRAVPEEPCKDLEFIENQQLNDFERARLVSDRKDQWTRFLNQSRKIYALLIGQGNRFFFTNKVDKRGRLYSQGYHVDPQGTKYKKAALELADKELVTGVPQ